MKELLENLIDKIESRTGALRVDVSEKSDNVAHVLLHYNVPIALSDLLVNLRSLKELLRAYNLVTSTPSLDCPDSFVIVVVPIRRKIVYRNSMYA